MNTRTVAWSKMQLLTHYTTALLVRVVVYLPHTAVLFIFVSFLRLNKIIKTKEVYLFLNESTRKDEPNKSKLDSVFSGAPVATFQLSPVMHNIVLSHDTQIDSFCVSCFSFQLNLIRNQTVDQQPDR